MKTLAKIKKVKTIAKKHKQSGFILWRGLSPVDQAPIVAIATLNSNNDKTGNMISTWILREDIAPHIALKNGADKSICGSCVFASGGGCYLTVFQAPLAVYKAFKKGNYPLATNEQLQTIASGRKVRIGSYGDPAMIPTAIWKNLLKSASGHTGYTHQYNEPWFDRELLNYCMVSANTIADSIQWNKKGVRTFTAITENEAIPDTAIVCPNTTHGIQCIDCNLCTGGKHGKSIVVGIHGSAQKINKFTQNRII